MVKQNKKHVITFSATPDEMKMIELIRCVNKRKTYSDTVRVLIMKEHEKILNQNVGMSIIKTEPVHAN